MVIVKPKVIIPHQLRELKVNTKISFMVNGKRREGYFYSADERDLEYFFIPHSDGNAVYPNLVKIRDVDLESIKVLESPEEVKLKLEIEAQAREEKNMKRNERLRLAEIERQQKRNAEREKRRRAREQKAVFLNERRLQLSVDHKRKLREKLNKFKKGERLRFTILGEAHIGSLWSLDDATLKINKYTPEASNLYLVPIHIDDIDIESIEIVKQ